MHRAPRWGIWAYAHALCLSLGATAWAEEPTKTGQAGSAEQRAADAKDVVRLKNGGLIRGTISELVPGERVTIVTVTGKVREIAMAEVAYAGPDEGQRASEPPEAKAPEPESHPTESEGTTGEVVRPYMTVNASRARLQLDSVPAGLTFYRQISASAAAYSGPNGGGVAVGVHFERLCTAPCNITIPAGTEILALSTAGASIPVSATSATFPAGQSQVIGKLQSRRGVRTAGWLVAAGSLGVGMYMILSSTGDNGKSNTGLLLGGTAIGFGGVMAGVYMALTPDKAHVDVHPAAPARPRAAAVPGLGLRAKF